MLATMSLAEIERAVRKDDLVAALATSVALWRGQRHPDLADLVTLLSSRCNQRPVAARSLSSHRFQDAWLRAVDDDPVGNLAPALATLTRALPFGSGPPHVRFAPWFERVDALTKITDPRIAEAFVAVLEQAPFVDAAEERLYPPIFVQLGRLGDARQVPRLEALVARAAFPRPWLRELFRRSVPSLVAALAALAALAKEPHADAVAIEQLFVTLGGRPVRRSTSPDADVMALLVLVRASPDDDDPRAVLADLWLERGDPRGQLVALQLKEARGIATPADLRAAARIVRAHEKEWLGAIALVSKKRLFVRGFLEQLTLARTSAAPPETWDAALADPAFATVRLVHKGGATEALYRRFVAVVEQ